MERQLYRTGIWQKATYSLVRHSVALDSNVILEPAERAIRLKNYLRCIALIYLGIGVYVLLRRWTAPGSTHFYIFCLVSFVAYSFHYTGKLDAFDSEIYWSNVVAWVLLPALFLHFVLTIPGEAGSRQEVPWLLTLIYLPGAVLSGMRHCCDATAGSERQTALGHRPAGNGLWRVCSSFWQRRSCGTAIVTASTTSCVSNSSG